MLTGKQVRVRFNRDRIVPLYIDPTDANWLGIAGQLLELFRGQDNRTRGELEDDIDEAFGNDPSQLVHQGLAKLLEDRCEFEVVAGHPPEQLREAVFLAAAKMRQNVDGLAARFDRAAILAEVAGSLSMTAMDVDQGLFADLKSAQRLMRFRDLTAERLLHRYNVGLAQAVLLRSTQVRIEVRGASPPRLRQLFRRVKFHRLVCDVEKRGDEHVRLTLDGPLSLFTSTLKYGLQLALFLPAVLQCENFELEADVRWGPQRKDKKFRLAADDGLVSDEADRGMYVPPELEMFASLFRKRIENWELLESTDVFQLGDGFWVPDFVLKHTASGKVVHLEVLGFWRRGSAEKHLERLRRHATERFLLAVSDQLHVDEAELAELPAGIHRFRQMPLPDEIARLADAQIG